MGKSKHTYKDSVFRKLFQDKEKLIELYNALSGNDYSQDTEVQIIPRDDSISIDRKNDLVFIIDNKLIMLIEQQSGLTPNMPLLMLIYIGREYKKLYFSRGFCNKDPDIIPGPELYLLYNGEEKDPQEQDMKLSDAFLDKSDERSIEATVKAININYEQGSEILRRSKVLSDYSRLIYLARQNWQETGDLETAIKKSIDTCVREGVLQEFLKENSGDVMGFLFEELSREACEAIREQDGYIQGLSEGMEKGVERGITALVRLCRKFDLTREEAKEQIMQAFSLSDEKAGAYMEQFWKMDNIGVSETEN